VHGLPERGEGTASSGVIPHAGGHQAARAGDQCHLREPADGIGHEMHNQLGQRGVEGAVGTR
jgi:hypothetical protein